MKKAEYEAIVGKIHEMTMKELSDLRTAIDDRSDAVRQEEADRVNAKVREVIEAGGFNPDEFLKGRGQVGPREPKYRDPQNKANVWGGRGKKPAWLQAKLEEGKSLDSFKVVQTAPTQKAA